MSEQHETQTEQIWLPADSSIPFWTAAFALVTLIGIFLWWPVAVIGAVITLGLLVKWSKVQAAENSELPRG